MNIFASFTVVISIFILVAILILIFEIAMFVSAFKNTAISSERRLLWLLGMLLLHPFVAIVYYFTDHQKDATR